MEIYVSTFSIRYRKNVGKKSPNLIIRRIIILNGQFIITPRILFNDENLSRTEIDVLSLIISLTFKKGFCFASNDYLKKYINTSERTITSSLSKLKQLKYIIIKTNNNKRRIYLNRDKIPAEISKWIARNCNGEVEKTCDYKIKNKNKKENKNINPYWLDHPEMIKEPSITEEERKELEDLLNNF